MTSTSPRPAVVLLSGGLDSTTCLAMAMDQGFQPYAMSFRYGQRHQFEIEAAKREVVDARARGAKAGGDCAAQARVLGVGR